MTTLDPEDDVIEWPLSWADIVEDDVIEATPPLHTDCHGCFVCRCCGEAKCGEEHDPPCIFGGRTVCEDCLPSLLEYYKDDIRDFADEVKVTGELEVYDPSERHAPSPEDYEAGDREAYTDNSVRASNRHNRTNYDALIEGLDRRDAFDRAIYEAIRRRVDELVD